MSRFYFKRSQGARQAQHRQVINGIKFDSKLEATRYCLLQIRLKAGDITDLEVHPNFLLQPAFQDVMGIKHQPITYTADFRYKEFGKTIIEDCKAVIFYATKKLHMPKKKSFTSETYQIRKKLFLYQHLKPGQEFREVH